MQFLYRGQMDIETVFFLMKDYSANKSRDPIDYLIYFHSNITIILYKLYK